MKKFVPAVIIFSFVLTTVSIGFESCKNKDSNEPDIDGKVSKVPVTVGSVIQAFPDDTSFFTQGLTMYNGNLYEGTGLEKHSKLMKVDMKTGKALQTVEIDPKFFGEGITILNDTVYQLTWQNHVVLVYTLKDFKKIKEFHLPTEGWGITTDGKQLIVSDGTSTLYFYDPSTFNLIKKTPVTDAGALAYNLNELEFIEGFVYANQWQLPYILKIDPSTGTVVSKIDLSSTWDRIKLKYPDANVPNGIAYDAATKKIYITGKNWPELYEIQLSQ
jgi:glutamine cyclotransferase